MSTHKAGTLRNAARGPAWTHCPASVTFTPRMPWVPSRHRGWEQLGGLTCSVWARPGFQGRMGSVSDALPGREVSRELCLLGAAIPYTASFPVSWCLTVCPWSGSGPVSMVGDISLQSALRLCLCTCISSICLAPQMASSAGQEFGSMGPTAVFDIQYILP